MGLLKKKSVLFALGGHLPSYAPGGFIPAVIPMPMYIHSHSFPFPFPNWSLIPVSGSVAEWLACWTQEQKGLGSNRSRDAVIGKLFTPIVPLFTKQQNW